MTEEDNNDKASDEININGNDESVNSNNLPDEDPNEKIKALQQNLDDKNNSYEDLYERYLRIAADFDNYKKRMSKEKTDLVTYGNEELIKALLNVIDNLERALQHSGAEGSSESIIKGVDLVYRQFLSCLEKFGLSRIDAEHGTKFDPNFHQAVEHLETDDLTPGLIVNEMIKGYMLKERLLRPSMVAVSKGMSSKPVSKVEPAPDLPSENKQEETADQTEELELDLSDDQFNLDNLTIDEDFTDNVEATDTKPDNTEDNSLNEDEFSIEVNIDSDNSNKDDILDLVEEDIKENN